MKLNLYSIVLNKYLSTRRFMDFVGSLNELDKIYFCAKNILPNIKEVVGSTVYEKASRYYCSIEKNCLINPEIEKPDAEIYVAMKMIHKALDKIDELEYPIKVRRYDVREEFESLVKELYPNEKFWEVLPWGSSK